MPKIQKIEASQISRGMITAGMLADNIINGIMPTMTSNANKVLGINSSAIAVELKSILGGTGITVSHGAGTITITATGSTAPAAHASTHITGGADPIQVASASQPGLLSAADWSTFNGKLSGNQTITLSGDVSGSGATSIATTIGALKVTNAMLAGSIAASKLVGTDIATVGTITAGVWNAGAITSSGLVYSAASYNQGRFGNLTIGKSGSGYPGIGYNVDFTASSNAYNYLVSDNAIFVDIGNSNAFSVKIAPSGTATNAITFVDAFKIHTTTYATTFAGNVTALGTGLFIAGEQGTTIGKVRFYHSTTDQYIDLVGIGDISNKTLTLPNLTATIATADGNQDFTSVGLITSSGNIVANGGMVTVGEHGVTNGTVRFYHSSTDQYINLVGIGDVTNKTLTLPNLTATIATIDGGQTFTSAVWNAGAITSSGNIKSSAGGIIAGESGIDGYLTLYNALNGYKTQLVSSTTASDKLLTLPNLTATIATVDGNQAFTSVGSITSSGNIFIGSQIDIGGGAISNSNKVGRYIGSLDNAIDNVPTSVTNALAGDICKWSNSGVYKGIFIYDGSAWVQLA